MDKELEKDKENNSHSGHRNRMRERFEKAGELASFSEHEVVEMLLYPYIPRKNTNELAHALMTRFHSIEEILGAEVEELESVEGISHSTAVSLNFLKKMIAYIFQKNAEKLSYDNKEALYDYIMRGFLWEPREMVRAVLLNGAMDIIKIELVARGDFYRANLDILELVRTALNCKCNYMILAHNHPNDTCMPSNQDILCTCQLIDKLKEYGIVLLDHLVVINHKYMSMKDTMLVDFPSPDA